MRPSHKHRVDKTATERARRQVHAELLQGLRVELLQLGLSPSDLITNEKTMGFALKALLLYKKYHSLRLDSPEIQQALAVRRSSNFPIQKRALSGKFLFEEFLTFHRFIISLNKY